MHSHFMSRVAPRTDSRSCKSCLPKHCMNRMPRFTPQFCFSMKIGLTAPRNTSRPRSMVHSTSKKNISSKMSWRKSPAFHLVQLHCRRHLHLQLRHRPQHRHLRLRRRCPKFLRAQPPDHFSSVLVRIDNIAPGHRHTKGPQGVQNSNRARVSVQYVWQSSISLRCFVQIPTAQNNSAVVQPFHHLIVPNESVLADSFVADFNEFSFRRGARHDSTGPVDC